MYRERSPFNGRRNSPNPGHLSDDGEVNSWDEGEEQSPTDISAIPEILRAEQGDGVEQCDVLQELIGNRLAASEDGFEGMEPHPVKLSKLKAYYEREEKRVLSLLSKRRTVKIDDEYRLRMGVGSVRMNTRESMIDYHLTVANCVGLSPLLPNARSGHMFGFEMELLKPEKDLKVKHAMLGFDPAGCVLYIGRSVGRNEDVYLAMAPNEFLKGRGRACAAGYVSGSPVMSRRHYRQTLMMMVHFLGKLPERSFLNVEDVYEQDLETEEPRFFDLTDAVVDKKIMLNFEEIAALDRLVVDGYDEWVDGAPDHWKSDRFLLDRSPIVITSRYGQNARIAVRGNEELEAEAWDLERDYSKIAFLTVAIATSIQCTEVRRWTPISTRELESDNPDGLFDGPDPRTRRPIRDLDDLDLVDGNGAEIEIFGEDGARVYRRTFVLDDDEPACGVLVDLTNIQGLFNPDPSLNPDRDLGADDVDLTDSDERLVQVEAYPLGFLRTAGNIQATGIPHCFYPALTRINKSVRRVRRRRRSSFALSDDEEEEDDDEEDEEEERDGGVLAPMDEVVKAVSSQFYNYVTHRVASRAGKHDSQQATVTAAVSGAFAKTIKDKSTAWTKRAYCERGLPSERFHKRICIGSCPKCCRAEFVYSIDVRGLKKPTGSSIFREVILPLTHAWKDKEIRKSVGNHLVVLKPDVFPALFDWVSYPITVLIEELYRFEMSSFERDVVPSPGSPYRLELLAALERTLCFCHTGSTAVFATTLMNPLGLSRSAIKDGLPMLLPVFKQDCVHAAKEHGFEIDPRRWPLKNGYPAMASKKAQVYTYSLSHFMAYQASFRISFASSIYSAHVYPGLSTPISNKAMRICNIAFDALFEDAKQLVAEGVRRDVAHRVANARTPALADAAASRGILRESCLKAWLKSDFPLAYGHNGGDDTFKLLVRAVAADDDEVQCGLPNWNKFACSPSTFVQSLLDMSAPVNPSPPRAPVSSTGAFLPVLKIAHESILSLAKDFAPPARQNFLKNVFKIALNTFNVRFFPAHKLHSGSAGSPYRKPVFNSWGNIGVRESRPLIPVEGPSAVARVPSVPPATVALNNAIASDCNAEWSASDLTIVTLRDVLNKTSLPVDFGGVSKADEPYVDDTYTWVHDRYDGTKPLHHLALLVSVIIASSLLPNLFMVQNEARLFRTAKDRDAVREVYDGLDWIAKGKKGMSDKRIFVCMFTTFIIALYEPQSPLRRKLDGAGRSGLGQPWTAKHSIKGVTYTNLVRLGILWGEGSGAYEKGTFGSTWGCQPDNYIRRLYRTLCEKLRQDDFCVFDTLSLLVGDRNARIFCRDHIGASCRPRTDQAP